MITAYPVLLADVQPDGELRYQDMTGWWAAAFLGFGDYLSWVPFLGPVSFLRDAPPPLSLSAPPLGGVQLHLDLELVPVPVTRALTPMDGKTSAGCVF